MLNTIKHDPNPPIIFPTEEEKQTVLADFGARMHAERKANMAGLPAAFAGIQELVQACAHKTGQSYHIRALLYSLWNGKPARLVEIVGLDRALREALLAVMNVFGDDMFFYDEIRGAFKDVGLFEWFLEEGGAK